MFRRIKYRQCELYNHKLKKYIMLINFKKKKRRKENPFLSILYSNLKKLEPSRIISQSCFENTMK